MSRALRAVPNVDGNVGVLTPAAAARFDRTPLIVHSHLRWDFVWQRPQQILSRLADRHPILFLEEPIDAASQPSLQITVTSEGIVRVVPALPGAGSLTTDARSAIILPLLESALKTHPALAGRFDAPIQWFYSPMTAPSYCGRFGAIGTVYDCMDELANFRFAPPDIAQRENFLISHADIIFTGGYEIYRAK